MRPKVIFGITTGFGASSYFRGLFSRLRDDGFEVALLAQDEAGAREFAVGEGAEFLPICARREPSPVNDLQTLAQIYRILRGSKFDVAVWGTPKVGLLGCIASRATNIRSVYVIHGLRYQGAQGISRRVLQLLEKLTVTLADDVITVGAQIADCLVADRIVSSPPRMIWNGSANGVVAPGTVDEKGARQTLGINDDQFVVGFVGRVTGDKGIRELLEAWSLFASSKPNVELLVAGAREPDSFKGELASHIESAPKVVWLGHIDRPQLVYGAMDVLVLPSRREGLPAVVMEASAHGKPVIASDRPGVGEAVVDGVTGYVVDCRTTELLVDRLNCLYYDSALAKQLGANGKRHIVEKYDRAILHQKWSQYLKSVAGSTG